MLFLLTLILYVSRFIFFEGYLNYNIMNYLIKCLEDIYLRHVKHLNNRHAIRETLFYQNISECTNREFIYKLESWKVNNPLEGKHSTLSSLCCILLLYLSALCYSVSVNLFISNEYLKKIPSRLFIYVIVDRFLSSR